MVKRKFDGKESYSHVFAKELLRSWLTRNWKDVDENLLHNIKFFDKEAKEEGSTKRVLCVPSVLEKVSEKQIDDKPVCFVKKVSSPGEVCFYCKDPAEWHLVDNEHETPIYQTCLKEKESAIKEHYRLKKLEAL